MDITKISIKRPVSIMMVMFIVILLGFVSVSKMEMELTPDDCDSSTVMKMDMNSMPVATFVIASDDMNTDELKTFAEDSVEPRLERQGGVASVEVIGGTEKEITVKIDPERLEGLGLTMTSVGQVLMQENSNQSNGSIEYGEKELTISTKLQMSSIDEIKKTLIQIADGTFVLVYFSETSLNMISLGGLSVGVGMLVDNSVVMLENIYRYRTTLGYGKIKGTYRAGREIRSSLVASTLTTIVIFVPFVFVSGMMIQMIKDLALAIVFSLTMSLVTSMTIVPMLAGNYVNNVHRNKAPRKLDFINKILNGSDVAGQVRNTVQGYTATTLKADGTELDIRITYPDESTSSLSNIEDMSIVTKTGTIPLSAIAEIVMDDVPSSIEHSDQSRYVTVSAEVFGRDSSSVNSDVQQILSQLTLPDGYTVKLGGSNEMMNEVFGSIALIIVLAAALVYMVMAAQFESFINPFIIMVTIPLAFTGAIFLLFLTGESINIMALIACLVLVGIVVNNGIVLIDYITILRNRDGMELIEAVKAACPTRLCPILMTAMTTILGQFPIIFSNGTNSETLKSMELVIAGGLTTSTFLTLVVVPLLYIYFDRFTTSKVGRKFNRRERLNPYEVELECR